MAYKDLIIGCFTNYNWEKIQYWVNSIDRSGFSGQKAMIVYNSEASTVSKLVERNYNIYAFQHDPKEQLFFYPQSFSIVVQRFYNLWHYLNRLPDINEYRYIITTDVKDVIFQGNPSTWLENNLGDKKICVSSESLIYKHEPWGDDNMRRSFPGQYDFMSTKNIWNCGVLSGTAAYMKDLFLNIFMCCQGNATHNPDQSALNILLNLEPYKSITKFVNSEQGWAAQLGTTADPSQIHRFKPYLLEPEPKILSNGMVTTNSGIPYTVVHQYDRVPGWKEIIEDKFKD